MSNNQQRERRNKKLRRGIERNTSPLSIKIATRTQEETMVEIQIHLDEDEDHNDDRTISIGGCGPCTQEDKPHRPLHHEKEEEKEEEPSSPASITAANKGFWNVLGLGLGLGLGLSRPRPQKSATTSLPSSSSSSQSSSPATPPTTNRTRQHPVQDETKEICKDSARIQEAIKQTEETLRAAVVEDVDFWNAMGLAPLLLMTDANSIDLSEIDPTYSHHEKDRVIYKEEQEEEAEEDQPLNIDDEDEQTFDFDSNSSMSLSLSDVDSSSIRADHSSKASIEAEVHHLRTRKQFDQNKIQPLENEPNKMQADLETDISKMAKLESEIKYLKLQMSEQEAKVAVQQLQSFRRQEDLMLQLQELSSKDLGLESKLSASRREVTTLALAKSKLETEMESLADEKSRSIEVLTTQLEIANAEVIEVKQENQKLGDAFSELLTEKTSVQTKLDETVASKVASDEKISLSQAELQNIQKEKEEWFRCQKELENQLELSLSRSTEFDAAVLCLEGQISSLKDETASLLAGNSLFQTEKEKELSSISKALDSAQDSLEKSQKAKRALREEMASLKEENSSTEKRLKEAMLLQAKVAFLENEVPPLMHDKSTLESDNKVLAEQKSQSLNSAMERSRKTDRFVDNLQEENSALNRKVIGLEAHREEMEMTLSEIQNQKDKLERGFIDVTAECSVAKEKEKSASARHKTELQTYLESGSLKFTQLMNTVDSLKAEIAFCSEEKSMLVAINESLEKEKQKIRDGEAKLEAAINEKGAISKKLVLIKDENQRIQQQLSEALAAFENMESKLAMSVSMAIEANKKVDESLAIKKCLENELEELSFKCDKFEGALSSLQAENDVLVKQRNNLISDNKAVTADKVNLARLIEDIEGRLKMAITKNETLNAKISDAKSEKHSIQMRLVQIQGSMSDIESKLATSQLKLIRVESEQVAHLADQRELKDQLVAAFSKSNELQNTLASPEMETEDLKKGQEDSSAEMKILVAEQNKALSNASRSLEDAESRLGQLISEKAISDGKVSEMKEEKNAVEKQLNEALNLMRDIENKFMTSESSLKAAKTEQNLSLQRQRELEYQLAASSSTTNELMSTLVSLKMETKRLQKEQRSLVAEKEYLQSEKTEALFNASRDIEDAERKLRLIVAEKNVSDAKVSPLESENMSIAKRLAQALNSLKDQSSKSENTEAPLVESMSEKDACLDRQRELEAQLVVSSSNSNNLQSTCARVQLEISSLKKTQEGMLTEKVALQAQTNEALSRANCDLEDAERKLKVIVEGKVHLDAKVCKLESEKVDIQKKLAEAQDSIADAGGKLATSESSLTEAMSEKNACLELQGELETQLAVAFSNSNDLQITVASLESEIKRLSEDQEAAKKEKALALLHAKRMVEGLTEERDLAASKAFRNTKNAKRKLMAIAAQKKASDARVADLVKSNKVTGQKLKETQDNVQKVEKKLVRFQILLRTAKKEKADWLLQQKKLTHELETSSSKTLELEQVAPSLQAEIKMLKKEQKVLKAAIETEKAEKADFVSNLANKAQVVESKLETVVAEKISSEKRLKKLVAQHVYIDENPEKLFKESKVSLHLEAGIKNLKSERQIKSHENIIELQLSEAKVEDELQKPSELATRREAPETDLVRSPPSKHFRRRKPTPSSKRVDFTGAISMDVETARKENRNYKNRMSELRAQRHCHRMGKVREQTNPQK